MSDFTIPKGLDFDFNVKVIEQDSFLPQDLTNMETATFTLVSKATPDVSTDISIPLTVIPDTIVDTVNTTENAVNGNITGHLSAVDTATLLYERGDKVDEYYLRPMYYGVINIVFTVASGIPSITTIVDNILVVPTGN